MILKLLKYELKHMWRIKCAVFILMIVLCTLFAGFVSFLNTAFGDVGISITSIISSLYYMFFVQFSLVLLAGVAVLSIVRFVKSLMGKETYLMRTLPVSIHSQLIAQLLATMFWMGAALLTVSVSDAIMDLITQHYIGGIAAMFLYINEGFTGIVNGIVFVYICFYICLHIYACLSVGFSFEKGKMAISVALYALTSFAEFGIAILAMSAISENWEWLTHEIFLVCFCGLFGLLYYCLTVYFLKNELNIE